MLTIMDVAAREILDSRGYPTVQARVSLAGGASGTAAVPAGASTGAAEALELRDGGSRFMGRGVLKAVESVEEIIRPRLLGMDATRQAEIDAFLQELDGTPTKSRLGANALLAVSLATARAASAAVGLPLYRYMGGISARLLPVPQLNVLNGGAHAGNNLVLQEFMVLPAGASTFSGALRMGAEIYHHLRIILETRGLATGIGDEGGFSPDLETHAQALDLLVEAIEKAGYEPGRDAFLAVDAAASEFYRDGFYHLEGKKLDAAGMVGMYEGWLGAYPLVSIEDGLAEDDWDGWKHMTEAMGSRIQLVGDDLFATNTIHLARGIGIGAANALLVKVNQIGTLTETMQAIQVARASAYSTVISHRSGETEDTFIADLAVATASGQIKAGAPARSERTAKYNRLLDIEDELGPEAAYAGLAAVLRPKAVDGRSR